MDLSEGDNALLYRIIAERIIPDFVAIPKPYAAEAGAKLAEEQQARVRDAEMSVYLSILPQVAYTRDPEHRRWADDFGQRYFDRTPTDESLIDGPLAKIHALARAYAESGLAADEGESGRMAEAYKESAVQRCRKVIEDRRRGR